MDPVSERVRQKILPVVEDLGYEIVDVEYIKKHGDMHLTVYIYRPEGISFDDCEKVHLAIDPILDELDPSGDKPYFLNVSSPGLDRHFKTDRDFERNFGKEVEIKLYAPLKGKKIFEGILKAKNSNVLVIEAGDANVQIEMSKVAYVRPLVKFE